MDTKDSRFLIIKNRNKWELPTLCVKEFFDDKEILCERYQKKYNHFIRDVMIIEESDNYIFVKCITDDKFTNNKRIL